MSRPQFLADQNFNEHIVEGVIREDPTVLFVLARNIGADRLPDPKLLELAAQRGLLLLTHDIETMPAFASNRIQRGLRMPGLLLVTQQRPMSPVIESLVLIGTITDAEEWEGQIRYLPL